MCQYYLKIFCYIFRILRDEHIRLFYYIESTQNNCDKKIFFNIYLYYVYVIFYFFSPGTIIYRVTFEYITGTKGAENIYKTLTNKSLHTWLFKISAFSLITFMFCSWHLISSVFASWRSWLFFHISLLGIKVFRGIRSMRSMRSNALTLHAVFPECYMAFLFNTNGISVKR